MDITPVARLSGPGAAIAALPLLLGFPPEESLVLVGVHGPRSRLGMALRVDLMPDHPKCLPRAEDLEPLVQALARNAAEQCLAFVVTETPDRDEVVPYADLVISLEEALLDAGIDLKEAALVRSGRWHSYICADSSCCPPEGNPVPPPPTALAAEAAYAGTVLREGRFALSVLIAPDLDAVIATERALEHVHRELADAYSTGTAEAYRARIESVVERRVRRLAAGPTGRLTHRAVARMAVALLDRPFRDRIALHCLQETAAAAESLWIDLLGRLPAPLDAAPATLLALSSWARGDGAMANVALDRALDSDPSYYLAQMVRTALDNAFPPSTVRKMLDFPPGEVG